MKYPNKWGSRISRPQITLQFNIRHIPDNKTVVLNATNATKYLHIVCQAESRDTLSYKMPNRYSVSEIAIILWECFGYCYAKLFLRFQSSTSTEKKIATLNTPKVWERFLEQNTFWISSENRHSYENLQGFPYFLHILYIQIYGQKRKHFETFQWWKLFLQGHLQIYWNELCWRVEIDGTN